MIWWIVGGVALLGGGYLAYDYYEQAQAASPAGQLNTALNGAIAQGESVATGVISDVEKYSPLALVAKAPAALKSAANDVASGAKSALNTIEGWF